MQTKAIRYSQHMPAAELNKNEKLDHVRKKKKYFTFTDK